MVKHAIKRLHKKKKQLRQNIHKKTNPTKSDAQNSNDQNLAQSIMMQRFGPNAGSPITTQAGNQLSSLVQSNQTHSNDMSRMTTEIDAYKKKAVENAKERKDVEAQLRKAKQEEEKSRDELEKAKVQLESKDHYLRRAQTIDEKRKNVEQQIAAKEQEIYDLQNKANTAGVDKQIAELNAEKKKLQRQYDDNLNYKIYIDKQAELDRLKVENEAKQKALESDEFTSTDIEHLIKQERELQAERERKRLLGLAAKHREKLEDIKIENAAAASPMEQTALIESLNNELKQTAAQQAQLEMQNKMTDIDKKVINNRINKLEQMEIDNENNYYDNIKNKAYIKDPKITEVNDNLIQYSKKTGAQQANNELYNDTVTAARNFRKSKLKNAEQQGYIDKITGNDYDQQFKQIEQAEVNVGRLDAENKALDELRAVRENLNEKQAINDLKHQLLIDGVLDDVNKAVTVTQFAAKQNEIISNHIDNGMALKDTLKNGGGYFDGFAESRGLNKNIIEGNNVLAYTDNQMQQIGTAFNQYVDEQKNEPFME